MKSYRFLNLYDNGAQVSQRLLILHRFVKLREQSGRKENIASVLLPLQRSAWLNEFLKTGTDFIVIGVAKAGIFFEQV